MWKLCVILIKDQYPEINSRKFKEFLKVNKKRMVFTADVEIETYKKDLRRDRRYALKNILKPHV